MRKINEGAKCRVQVLKILIVIFSIVSLSGCATISKKRDLEMQGLKNQVSVLEAQIREKNLEIESLRQALSGKAEMEAEECTSKVGKKKKVVGKVKSLPNVRQVQIALKNAGYNPGAVDGKMGKATRDAIRAFQKANGLGIDGKAGKETWKLLEKNVYMKKVK